MTFEVLHLFINSFLVDHQSIHSIIHSFYIVSIDLELFC